MVFSSHNIEHQPCLITHLAEVASLMRTGGWFLLAIPDKRYCFDHLLPESTITDVLEPFLSGRRDHAVRSLVQGRMMHTHNEAGRTGGAIMATIPPGARSMTGWSHRCVS